MTLRSFIKQHRRHIEDVAVRNGYNKPTNDEQRTEFVMNHEPLYLLASSYGVKLW